MTALQSAAGIYCGDLLPGCYDDWVLPERERLRPSRPCNAGLRSTR